MICHQLPSDEDEEADSDVFMSDVSSVSSGSGDSDDDGSGSESTDSATFSDIEDAVFLSTQEMIEKLMHEIEMTRILDPIVPRLPKVSQLHLDEWCEIEHPNFRKKLRVDPYVFDGLLALLLRPSLRPKTPPTPSLPRTPTGPRFWARWHSSNRRFKGNWTQEKMTRPRRTRQPWKRSTHLVSNDQSVEMAEVLPP
jgi:hypothetical protein